MILYCGKCRGLIVIEYGEIRCVNCGARFHLTTPVPLTHPRRVAKQRVVSVPEEALP